MKEYDYVIKIWQLEHLFNRIELLLNYKLLLLFRIGNRKKISQLDYSVSKKLKGACACCNASNLRSVIHSRQPAPMIGSTYKFLLAVR